jgi:hypothetical protein
MDEFQVIVKILLREARRNPSEIIGSQIVARFDLAGQETLPEGRICHDSHPQFSTSLEKSDFGIFNVESPRRIFDLKGRDCQLALKRRGDYTRVDLVGMTEGFRANF